jgi:hypothetical protein
MQHENTSRVAAEEDKVTKPSDDDAGPIITPIQAVRPKAKPQWRERVNAGQERQLTLF